MDGNMMKRWTAHFKICLPESFDEGKTRILIEEEGACPVPLGAGSPGALKANVSLSPKGNPKTRLMEETKRGGKQDRGPPP